MMRYSVRHLTRFTYAFPVRFARCNLRLAPIAADGQMVESHLILTDPAAEVTPARGNGFPVTTHRLLVDRPVTSLAIESRATVMVDRPVPPVAAGRTVAQAAADALAARALDGMAPANYLFPSPLIPAVPDIAAWCARELAATRDVGEAALALARAIQAEFRYDGSATTLDTGPAEAFAERHGVCQDFAQVMISGARACGLAAAYVSGYLWTAPPPGQPRLVGADATHAWVMIHGGADRGWIGLDPTNGCLVGEDHIVLGLGRDYGDVAPIDGVFLGQDGQSIHVSVDVEPLADARAACA